MNLVPPAVRPGHRTAEFIETSEDTIWYNPFDYDVAVKLYVGARGKAANTPAEEERWKALSGPQRQEARTGVRTYVIPAKSERAIPSEFDMGIQHYKCSHPDCLGSRGLYCKNSEHIEYRKIVAGLYPKLVNRGTQRTPITQTIPLDDAIDDQVAKRQQALEAAKMRLAEANNARDAFLIAQADLQTAHRDIEAEKAQMVSEAQGAVEHQKAILEVSKPVAEKQTNPAPAGAKKDK